jgi:hypothetical protein
MKRDNKDWTTVSIPRSMKIEIDKYKKPYEPNYAFFERMMKRVRR